MMNAEPPAIIYLISMPRSLTTVFERSMKARGDLVIVHEPFWQMYIKESLNMRPEVCDGMGPIAKQSEDFDDVLNGLDNLAASTEKSVFVKDFVGRTLDEFRRRPNYVKRPDVQFVLLFREPEKTVLSYLSNFRSLPHEVAPLFHPRSAICYDKLLEFHQHLTEIRGHSPLVIHGPALLVDPRATMQKVCTAVGLPFSEKAFTWEPGYQDEWNPIACLWHERVTRSTEFNAAIDSVGGSGTTNRITKDQLTENEKSLYEEIVQDNGCAYEALKALAGE